MAQIKLDFKFRERLNKILGGEHHNYCLQCGACVAVCPAARYATQFNPKQILLKTLLGDEEELVKPESVIWLCTNCYTCYERCPQDVRPVEVIIALKNLAADLEVAPANINKFSETIAKTGRSVTVTRTVNDRRAELGLEELKEVPIDELQKILDNEMDEK
jgi:heterodisulfide reductase subunit C